MSSETEPLKTKEEILKNFNEKKENYALLIKENKFSESLTNYKDLVKEIEKELNEKDKYTQEEKDLIINGVLISSYLNMSLLNIKLADWNSVISNANKILQYDKFNVKALYRKCFAFINLCDFDNAQNGINEIKNIMPNNPEVQKLIQIFEDKKNDEKLKEYKKYKNMMKCYHKLNEEEEYNNLSEFGKFWYGCKGYLAKIFCCCKKRKRIKKIE